MRLRAAGQFKGPNPYGALADDGSAADAALWVEVLENEVRKQMALTEEQRLRMDELTRQFDRELPVRLRQVEDDLRAVYRDAYEAAAVAFNEFNTLRLGYEDQLEAWRGTLRSRQQAEQDQGVAA